MPSATHRAQTILAGSRLRRVLGKHTVILRYAAPSSGRPVELPVWAAPNGTGWVVLVARHDDEHWWRAFRRPLAATVTDDQPTFDVVGRLVTDPEERLRLTETYLAAIPMARRQVRPGTPVVVFDRVGR